MVFASSSLSRIPGPVARYPEKFERNRGGDFFT